MTAYKQFKELCEQKKVTPYRVAVSTGIAQTTFSDWKKGEYTPKIDKLCKIANYFEVPVTVFIEGYDGQVSSYPGRSSRDASDKTEQDQRTV